MPTQLYGFPGNGMLEVFLIVALGALLSSSVGWLVATRVAKQPTTRHLVLSAALIGCLALPGLASVFAASGVSLVAIPLLPGEEAASDPLAPSRPAQTPRLTAIELAQSPGIELASTTSPQASDLRTDRSASPPATVIAPTPRVVLNSNSAPSGRRPERLQDAARLVLLVWGLGAAVVLGGLARSYLDLKRLRQAARRVPDGPLLLLLQEVCGRLGVVRVPELLTSSDVAAPIAAGLRRPSVVLPGQLLRSISEDETRDVLVHEVAHILRRDHRIILLQRLAQALYWPIVTVHGLNRALERAREELCDNFVLRDRDALSYGETLLHVAAISLDARPRGVTAGVLHWRGKLEERIAGLLDPGRSTMTTTNRWFAWGMTALFIAGGATAGATRLRASGTEPTSIQATSKPAADEAEKSAERSILVRVEGPDGRPLKGAKIHQSIWTKEPIKAPNHDVVTDESGSVRLPLPRSIEILRLWAASPGCVPLFANWERHEKPDETIPAVHTFRLSQGTTIGGSIRNERGEPIPGVAVEARLVKPDRRNDHTSPSGWLALHKDEPVSTSAPITDAQGRWTLNNVPAGDDVEVNLKLLHPDYVSDTAWGVLQLTQNITMKSLRDQSAMLVMKQGVRATGTILDPEGRPVAGAVVVCGERPYWEQGRQEVRTDEKGTYRLPALEPARRTVTVVAQGWQPQLRQVDFRPDMEPADFRLSPGKPLRVRFLDPTGKPVAGTEVMIDKWRGGESLYNVVHPNVLPTGIPAAANADGFFEWTWAPNDAVTYQLSAPGFAEQTVDLTADDAEQTVTLQRVLRISGSVTDAATGRPVTKVTAMPVLEFGPQYQSVVRDKAVHGSDGRFDLSFDRVDAAHRVWIEAPGYRSAMSDAFHVGDADRAWDVKLEPAPAVQGRVVDKNGQGVAGARVFLATRSQSLHLGLSEPDMEAANLWVLSDSQGAYSFPAQFERFIIVAMHKSGYSETTVEPDGQPGVLMLKPWAHVEGRLTQAGRPVSAERVFIQALNPSRYGGPNVKLDYSATTDHDGRFRFDQVPPTPSRMAPPRSAQETAPIFANQFNLMDLAPGEHVTIDLSERGSAVTGRVGGDRGKR